MRKVTSALGGLWISARLLIRCKCKTGKGSYLAWRNETAFGKDGEFPQSTPAFRWKEIMHWAAWAWSSRK
jgi:hypothetical protein